MNKKTIFAGIAAALASCGLLFGAGLTDTAHAASPTSPSAASEVAPEASLNFGVTNGLEGVTLKLVGIWGATEGHPPLGSELAYGQRHGIEVQTYFLAESNVIVSYQVHVDKHGSHGGYVGDIQLQMNVPWFACGCTTRISLNNTQLPMQLGGSGMDAMVLPG
jgi:hypothetical protein